MGIYTLVMATGGATGGTGRLKCVSHFCLPTTRRLCCAVRIGEPNVWKQYQPQRWLTFLWRKLLVESPVAWEQNDTTCKIRNKASYPKMEPAYA